MKPWEMEPRTKTCGPIPGGFILTHTLVDSLKSLGASDQDLKKQIAAIEKAPESSFSCPMDVGFGWVVWAR